MAKSEATEITSKSKFQMDGIGNFKMAIQLGKRKKTAEASVARKKK